MMQVTNLRLSELVRSEVNVRSEYLKEGLDDLTASVRQYGVCVPIFVRADGERWEVLDGFRRVLAARAVGLESVPAIIVPAAAGEADSLAWVLNFQREPVSFLAEAQWLGMLVSGRGVPLEQVAVWLGRSAGYVRARVGVLSWPQSLVEYCSRCGVSFSVAREYARLGYSVELGQALEWDAVNGPSYRQAAAYVDAILQAREIVVTPEQKAEAERPLPRGCGACGAEIDWATARNLLVCGECCAALGLSTGSARPAEGGVKG